MENMTNGDSKTQTWKAATLAFLVLSAFLFVQTVSAIKNYRYVGRDAVNINTIAFEGTGEVSAVPDVASFSFTSSADAGTVATAQDKVTKTTGAALKILETGGVDKKDIKTSDYSIYPKYEYSRAVCSQMYCPPSNQVLVGYTVSQTITVKVREVAKAGEILGNLGETGVTNLSGLNFTIDNEDSLKRDARQKAIADAKGKAVELSKDLGVKLVRIVSYSEAGDYPIYYAEKAMLGMGGDGAVARPTPEIPTGENKITSRVTIVYEIR